MMTIIKIKYVEYLSNDDDTAKSKMSVEKEMLVNIDCPIRMILDYVRKVACLDDRHEFDLCDDVNCQMKNVSLYEPCARGTDIFQSDSTYYIVTFERDENGQMTNLTPLLSEKTAKKCFDIISKVRKPLRKSELTLKSNNSN